jgi:hypothetical protein
MTNFEFTLSDYEADRAYVLVDDIFDISMLRTEEGLIVDVYQKDESELLATLAICDRDIIATGEQ